MKQVTVDIIVLGSGFAGSLTAMILHRIGRSVALIDKATHPRFAIGESSTPIANMVLRDLATKYDFPRLLPLCRYGTWRDTYPDLRCGIKRGFSYFAHQTGMPFEPTDDHRSELLVAASADDQSSDTQWLRADVDAFLCREASAVGIQVLEGARIETLEHGSLGHWSIRGSRDGDSFEASCNFVIDATGEAGLVPRALGVGLEDDSCNATHSRAIFGHFVDVADWHDMMNGMGGATEDHPFNCDHSAQHHLLDGAWMWALRFEADEQHRCSLGLVIDERKHPLDEAISPEGEWASWLARYPSLEKMLANADLAEQPRSLIRTGRLQRRWREMAGVDWALLPHTAGFVDPLHSTGIAQTLCGIERLVRIIEMGWQVGARMQGMMSYERGLRLQLDFIDRLVSGCYAALGNFDLFASYSMLYFAAATTYERRRTDGAIDSCSFLGHVPVLEARRQLDRALSFGTEEINDWYFDKVAELVAPFNQVGLCDRAADNMYRYTVAPT